MLNAGRDLRNGRWSSTSSTGSPGTESAQRWSRSEKWSGFGSSTCDPPGRVLNAGRDLRNGRKAKNRHFQSCLLSAQRWSRSEKWSAQRPGSDNPGNMGAQRWSRSEKWSGAPPNEQTQTNPVLNAGRDLRNGRPSRSALCVSPVCAQRWSRSEKWSADRYCFTVVASTGCSTLVAI